MSHPTAEVPIGFLGYGGVRPYSDYYPTATVHEMPTGAQIRGEAVYGYTEVAFMTLLDSIGEQTGEVPTEEAEGLFGIFSLPDDIPGGSMIISKSAPDSAPDFLGKGTLMGSIFMTQEVDDGEAGTKTELLGYSLFKNDRGEPTFERTVIEFAGMFDPALLSVANPESLIYGAGAGDMAYAIIDRTTQLSNQEVLSVIDYAGEVIGSAENEASAEGEASTAGGAAESGADTGSGDSGGDMGAAA